ncbi:MAG: metal ABC transporter ATP-binding protein [Clostridium sp.]|nr:metal ABC transporter ATP-binding protein [Clostridium sp.]
MIKINDMSFRYEKNSPVVLSHVNLDIPDGVYLSVIGENGSCKTTLIKLILGLLSPNSGSININTKNIGYVPQRVDSFNSQFPISVYEILKVHGKALKLDIKASIDYVLNKVNMTEFKDNLIGNLSGGQRQRVFIARALMGNPDLIILDEPSTGVDYKNQLEIYSLLSSLNKNEKTTIISIEHNLETALKYSTHILKIDEGVVSLKNVSEFKEELQKVAGA